jgi:3',5'-cyclic AMP phosphodiesterase CpdA
MKYNIAQFSDPHFGEMGYQSDKIQTTIKEVDDLSPNLVVTTGDLTGDGLTRQFELAHSALKQLKPSVLTMWEIMMLETLGMSVHVKLQYLSMAILF